jgi:protein-L-isoaspartate(D-aspartate) O-methyltransferase
MDRPRMARWDEWRTWRCAFLVIALIPLGGWTCSTGMPESQHNPHDPFAPARQRMVEDQIAARGVRHPAVLAAMGKVRRHLFVPESATNRAYEDYPLQIGDGQTISQPFIVAYMTEALSPRATDRVLEVGTGSGYQAAVLATIVAEVYSIEIIPALAEQAAQRLRDLGYDNVTVRTGDGFAGWPDMAPFDAVIVTAAPDQVPPPLLQQLRVGGKLVIPVGSGDQKLVRWTRTDSGFEQETLLPVRFVPMTVEAQRRN